jgi:hypothetical protein
MACILFCTCVTGWAGWSRRMVPDCRETDLFRCLHLLVAWYCAFLNWFIEAAFALSGLSDKYLPTLRAVHVFRYSPLVRFSSTVGKFDASERNHECLFIYHFVTYRCEYECLSNKPITHTVWHTWFLVYCPVIGGFVACTSRGNTACGSAVKATE